MGLDGKCFGAEHFRHRSVEREIKSIRFGCTRTEKQEWYQEEAFHLGRIRTKRSCWQILFFKQVVDDFLPLERDQIHRPLAILLDVSTLKRTRPFAKVHAAVPITLRLDDWSCAE